MTLFEPATADAQGLQAQPWPAHAGPGSPPAARSTASSFSPPGWCGLTDAARIPRRCKAATALAETRRCSAWRRFFLAASAAVMAWWSLDTALLRVACCEVAARNSIALADDAGHL